MSGVFQFTQLLMLTVSVVLQFCAAFFAFRLMKLSRKAPSWILISAALLLMAVRRAMTFHGLLSGNAIHPLDFHAELIALLGSLLLLAGLFSIAPLFLRLYASPGKPNGTLFGELFEKITCGVAVYEATDKGRDFIIRDINPAAERIEKAVRAHVTGRRLTEVCAGMEEFGLPDVLRRVWKSGRPENFPMRYYQDDRVSGWRDTYVYRRPSGEVVAVYNDVSAQMRMQKELELREREFRLLFERSPLPYQLLDSEGRILDVNPAWLRLTGLERSAAVGRSFGELLTRTGRQQFQQHLAGLKKSGSASDTELEIRRIDGSLRKVRLMALSVKDGAGGAEQTCCTLHEESVRETGADAGADIRELAQELAAARRDLQRQRLTALGDLTAGLVHELSAPLAAARNAFELMRRGLPGQRQEFAEMASHELARMTHMMERMYRFHEPLSTDCESLDLNAMLDNTLLLVRGLMRERRTQLQDERAPVLPSVTLPPAAVMLVLVNPIQNSLEAMPPGGTLTLRTGPDGGGGVWVEIEDNGPGIPEEFLPHLFEPFTTFRHGGGQPDGLGMGMAAVWRTLDVLGGSVTVRSGTGEGTCVRIVLPASISTGGLC
jgi:PAS domain S-box-containing protein